jgi:membrane protein DedA with SNARE-associated domain
MLAWIAATMEEMGHVGIPWLMLLENILPPLPSEIIMPLAGYLTAAGPLQFWGVVAAGTSGSLAGAVSWYAVGRTVSGPRLREWFSMRGEWVGFNEHDFDRVHAWLERHCRTVVFVGRVIPGVRTLVSVPAGVAKMPFAPFLAWSTAGTLVWVTMLAYIGRRLGNQYALVDELLDPIAIITIAALVVAFVWRIVRQTRRRHRRARRQM